MTLAEKLNILEYGSNAVFIKPTKAEADEQEQYCATLTEQSREMLPEVPANIFAKGATPKAAKTLLIKRIMQFCGENSL